MVRRTSAKQGRQGQKTESEGDWLKRYRLWDANRRIFVYPENWIEPDLRLPAAARATLGKIGRLICRRPRPKGIEILLTGRNRPGALAVAQTLARDLGKNLYLVDLSNFVSKTISETEKNLDRVFDAAKKSSALLFFEEADALFGKRSEVKDSHDRYSNIALNYLLQRVEKGRALAILASSKRRNIDEAFRRRFQYIVPLAPRRKRRSE
jgi:SpoVK/Ycf46/Vps4 family AAA+-type ATPase